MSLTDNPQRGDQILRLLLSEPDYPRFLDDRLFAKNIIDQIYQDSPELFPANFEQGYVFNGFTQASIKQGYKSRRIRLKTDKTTVTIAPAFLMPYMTAKTEEVEKALFLRRFNVPYWGITYVFGRNPMYWYRMEQSLGRFDIVGTTIKKSENLPQDLLADEKHTRRKGKKHYIAMTVANECILGAEMTDSASEESLTNAYGVFAEEARRVKPDYQPETVNTDGWSATQNAWKTLFSGITVILCFLHAFIKIRDRATKVLKASFDVAADKVWSIYEATNKRSFSQKIRRLQEWADAQVPDSPMKQHILDLCKKKNRFIQSYDHANAHRTSNMVDRLMKFFDRACFDALYFHGTLDSSKQRVRAWAILWNFCPSSPITVKKHKGKLSPAERLNKKSYADNWLENLLISASMNGKSSHQQNPL